jgi:hypothetical protein
MVSLIAVEKCVTVIRDHEYPFALELLRPQVCGSINRFSKLESCESYNTSLQDL